MSRREYVSWQAEKESKPVAALIAVLRNSEYSRTLYQSRGCSRSPNQLMLGNHCRQKLASAPSSGCLGSSEDTAQLQEIELPLPTAGR